MVRAFRTTHMPSRAITGMISDVEVASGERRLYLIGNCILYVLSSWVAKALCVVVACLGLLRIRRLLLGDPGASAVGWASGKGQRPAARGRGGERAPPMPLAVVEAHTTMRRQGSSTSRWMIIPTEPPPSTAMNQIFSRGWSANSSGVSCMRHRPMSSSRQQSSAWRKTNHQSVP